MDAYFSGTKIKHLFDMHDGLRRRPAAAKSSSARSIRWLIWRLSDGRRHVTDVSNASRTLLFNIHTLDWDDELLKILDIPRAMLPEVRSSSEIYGRNRRGVVRPPDSHCRRRRRSASRHVRPGVFRPRQREEHLRHRLLSADEHRRNADPVAQQSVTTIGWGLDGRVTYCLEGSVFIAGAVVQWLRDGLGIIKTSTDVERLATSVPDTGGVYFVPAFVGLGAPYWDPYARGAILGLTRGATAAHLARAAVESMAYQTCDVLEAMQRDSGIQLSELKVDGGASVNHQLMQFQADLLGVTVRRPVVAETTALGAAYLAGLAVGYWHDPTDIADNWAVDDQYEPSMPAARREALIARWHEAVQRAKDWAEH